VPSGLGALGLCILFAAQGQRPHRVDHWGDGLMLGNRLHPSGERLEGDVRARHEGEREDKELHSPVDFAEPTRR